MPVDKPTAFPSALVVGMTTMGIVNQIPGGLDSVSGFFVGFSITLFVVAYFLAIIGRA